MEVSIATDLDPSLDVAVVATVTTVGSNVPGKQTENVTVGCRDSAWVLASVFVLVSIDHCTNKWIHLINKWA